MYVDKDDQSQQMVDYNTMYAMLINHIKHDSTTHDHTHTIVEK